MVHDKMSCTNLSDLQNAPTLVTAGRVGLLPYWRRQHRPRRCADLKLAIPFPPTIGPK